VQPGHDPHVHLHPANDPPDVLQQRASVLLEVVGVQPLRQQPCALDLQCDPILPSHSPAHHRVRMPPPPGVHTTATVPNRPPNATSERAPAQTPRSSRMHTTLPTRSARGQNPDNHTQPKMTEIARTA
jgi:hypothetical protein